MQLPVENLHLSKSNLRVINADELLREKLRLDALAALSSAQARAPLPDSVLDSVFQTEKLPFFRPGNFVPGMKEGESPFSKLLELARANRDRPQAQRMLASMVAGVNIGRDETVFMHYSHDPKGREHSPIFAEEFDALMKLATETPFSDPRARDVLKRALAESPPLAREVTEHWPAISEHLGFVPKLGQLQAWAKDAHDPLEFVTASSSWRNGPDMYSPRESRAMIRGNMEQLMGVLRPSEPEPAPEPKAPPAAEVISLADRRKGMRPTAPAAQPRAAAEPAAAESIHGPKVVGMPATALPQKPWYRAELERWLRARLVEPRPDWSAVSEGLARWREAGASGSAAEEVALGFLEPMTSRLKARRSAVPYSVRAQAAVLAVESGTKDPELQARVVSLLADPSPGRVRLAMDLVDKLEISDPRVATLYSRLRTSRPAQEAARLSAGSSLWRCLQSFSGLGH